MNTIKKGGVDENQDILNIFYTFASRNVDHWLFNPKAIYYTGFLSQDTNTIPKRKATSHNAYDMVQG